MSSTETGEENGNTPGIEEYEQGVLQLGDTELNGVPEEQIIEQYGEADIDAVVYHGDASKKQHGDEWLDVNQYTSQLEETYTSLNRIGEALDVDVLTLSGNHAPIKGNHYDDEEYVEEVEELLDEEYGGFSDFEGNAYEFFIDSEEMENDNLIDFSGSVYETGDISLVGLGTHMEPEMDEEVYSFLNADPGLEDFGYGEDILEEAADELSEEPGFEYGFLSSIPLIGNWIERIGDKIAEAMNYGAVEVDPEDLDLEDIEELGEEFMTEEHINYLETVDEIKSSEEYREFQEKTGRIEELIESAENDVALFNHSTPYGEENQYGSMALTEITERHGDEIEMIGGGHSHESGVYEMNEVPVVNAAETYTEIGFGDELYTEQYGIGGEAQISEEQVSEEPGAELDEIASRIPDEQVPEELVDQIMDEKALEREEALMEAKKFQVVMSMNQGQDQEVMA